LDLSKEERWTPYNKEHKEKRCWETRRSSVGKLSGGHTRGFKKKEKKKMPKDGYLTYCVVELGLV
jgi:hypothetical protein